MKTVVFSVLMFCYGVLFAQPIWRSIDRRWPVVEQPLHVETGTVSITTIDDQLPIWAAVSGALLPGCSSVESTIDALRKVPKDALMLVAVEDEHGNSRALRWSDLHQKRKSR